MNKLREIPSEVYNDFGYYQRVIPVQPNVIAQICSFCMSRSSLIISSQANNPVFIGLNSSIGASEGIQLTAQVPVLQLDLLTDGALVGSEMFAFQTGAAATKVTVMEVLYIPLHYEVMRRRRLYEGYQPDQPVSPDHGFLVTFGKSAADWLESLASRNKSLYSTDRSSNSNPRQRLDDLAGNSTARVRRAVGLRR